ncbi:hypothetical protein CANINC_002670 [Pichia inconspicua]|uniref:Uncharacterized protein n=1 Tax=Pichia inconspicua TaxID=52247 RepID=A0A4T0X0K3_9ASCO|nr:hypothetical protein CANINC_002670 [[Candida] inconspicua]
MKQRASKKSVTKTRTPEPADISIDALQSELQSNASANTNSDTEAFLRNNGDNPLTLKQFFELQNNLGEIGFTPDVIDDYRLNSAKSNPNLSRLFSTDNFEKVPNLVLQNGATTNFKFDKDIVLSFNDGPSTTLQSGCATNFPYNETSLRSGYVFNTGGVSLTLEWCPLTISSSKYLFVVSTAENADLSEFSKSDSLLTILEYTENGQCSVVRRIIVKAIVKELEFAFVFDQDTCLLSLTLSDGTVQVWKITEDILRSDDVSKTNYYSVDESSICKFKIDLPNTMIISSSFTSSDELCVSTNTGLIALFSVSKSQRLYMVSTRIPGITCIKSSLPDEENNETFDLFISSCEPNAYLGRFPHFDKLKALANNIRIEELYSSHREWTFNKGVQYVTSTRSFLSVEIPGFIQRTNPRSKEDAQRLKILNDGEINSIGTQTFQKNCLTQTGQVLLSGHTNGSLRVSNLFNTMTNFDKKHPFTLKILQLHQRRDKSFVIDLSYSVDKTGDLPPSNEKPKQLTLSKFRTLRLSHDSNIQPTKMAMNGQILASCWGNGLLIIEQLVY